SSGATLATARAKVSRAHPLRYTDIAVRLAMRLPRGARGGSPPGSTVGTCVARVGRAVRLGRPASRRIRFARIALKDGLMFDRTTSTLTHVDPEIDAAIAAENRRQEEH